MGKTARERERVWRQGKSDEDVQGLLLGTWKRAGRQAGRRGGVGGHGMAATHLRARLPGEDDRRGGGLGWLAGPGGDELGQKLGKSFSFFFCLIFPFFISFSVICLAT